MYRIHKNTDQGNSIIDETLDEGWSNEENRYEGNIYYGLLNNTRRENLIQLMLIEQGSICCYCMKEITVEDTSIEHIIPQASSDIILQTYLTVPELSNSIVHRDFFNRNTRIIPPELYPHDLGYNNFIASCRSSVSCNNKRGNKNISLFMYDDLMVDSISYESFGSCVPLSMDINIDALNLNNNFLVMVRRIWYLISKEDTIIEEISNPESLQLLVNELVVGLEDKYIETFSGENSRVPELIKYRWFLDYYR